MTELEELEKRLEDIQADIDKLKAKNKGPVVPWVGALVTRKYSLNSYYVWVEDSKNPDSALILDSPLHPQFMPNDGTNPWPDDMEVQVMFANGNIGSYGSDQYDWPDKQRLIGSRPACGWAEYMKERE